MIDDHCRFVYAQVRDDKTATRASEVLTRVVAWFAARGVTIERILSDNGSAYRSHHCHQVCDQLSIRVKKPRPYRPQSNAKTERSHPLADG